MPIFKICMLIIFKMINNINTFILKTSLKILIKFIFLGSGAKHQFRPLGVSKIYLNVLHKIKMSAIQMSAISIKMSFEETLNEWTNKLNKTECTFPGLFKRI